MAKKKAKPKITIVVKWVFVSIYVDRTEFVTAYTARKAAVRTARRLSAKTGWPIVEK